MRFQCEFVRLCDGARKTLFTDLTTEEVASVNAARNASRCDVLAQAYALRHLYKLAPDGFRHLQNGVKPAPEAVTELPAR